LAKSIEYHGIANASAQSPGIGRQARQVLLYEVTELLDVANIQDEILSRLRVDTRCSDEQRPQLVKRLDGQIINLTEVSCFTSIPDITADK